MEAIRLVRHELDERTPLIGFSGAPFTLASYMVEGGHSRNYEHIKQLMYGDPETYGRLMALIADAVVDYLLCPDRGRRAGGAAVRLLGRLPGAVRLRALRAAATCATWSPV